MPDTVRDGRGRIPAYVIENNTLRHQPSGLTEALEPGASSEDIRQAQLRIKRTLLRAKGERDA